MTNEWWPANHPSILDTTCANCISAAAVNIVYTVQNVFLANDFLEDLSTWAGGVTDSFRTAETSVTAELHALELRMSTLSSEVSAKRSIFRQQKESDDRVESDLRERMEEEKGRHEENVRRKESERRRYAAMLEEISQMHAATMASMTTRQKELRAKLEREREIVLEEQVGVFLLHGT